MDRLLQDIRFALRLLWKDRSFSATTVATLALCLAANIAIFAVVNGVLRSDVNTNGDLGV